MIFLARSLLVAGLLVLVGLTANAARAGWCPLPRFQQIGHVDRGRSIIVFDACLGAAYATPVFGLDAIQKQKGWNIHG